MFHKRQILKKKQKQEMIYVRQIEICWWYDWYIYYTYSMHARKVGQTNDYLGPIYS